MTTARRAPRGQSLVLFALTVLLLTVMVTLTLGIGMRVKEKMELQHVTDAAAYSNAVTTARALNSIAILNRAEVSVMVTLAATQSLISWTSIYLASLNAIQTSIGLTMPICTAAAIWNPSCAATCTRMATIASNAANEYNTVWNEHYRESGQTDGAAGAEARNIQGAATAIRNLQEDIYTSLHEDFLRNQELTKKIVARASQGHKWNDEYVVDDAAGAVSMRETKITGRDGSLFTTPSGGSEPYYALNPRNASREIAVKAAMGSRGNGFVRSRGHGALIALRLIDKLNLNPMMGETAIVTNDGMGYWTKDAAKHSAPGPAPYAAFADDHGRVSGTIVGSITCPMVLIPSGTEAEVESDDSTESTDDRHTWTGGADGDNAMQMNHPHTMGGCTNCPGVWTMFIDLNPEIVGGNEEDHLHGQPKNIAVVRRNYRARCDEAIYDTGTCAGADPWNLLFRFRFKPSGGQGLDNTGLTTVNGDNLSNQIAVATGLTYFHRPGYWREPPNFFNPFWRGTLVSGAVDRQGDPRRNGPDLRDMARVGGGASGTTAQAVIDALRGAQFLGWQ